MRNVIIFVFLIGTSLSHFQSRAENVICGLVGESIELPCTLKSKNSAVSWSKMNQEISFNSNVNPVVSDRINVEVNLQTLYHLIISNITFEDAGFYHCATRVNRSVVIEKVLLLIEGNTTSGDSTDLSVICNTNDISTRDTFSGGPNTQGTLTDFTKQGRERFIYVCVVILAWILTATLSSVSCHHICKYEIRGLNGMGETNTNAVSELMEDDHLYHTIHDSLRPESFHEHVNVRFNNECVEIDEQVTNNAHVIHAVSDALLGHFEFTHLESTYDNIRANEETRCDRPYTSHVEVCQSNKHEYETPVGPFIIEVTNADRYCHTTSLGDIQAVSLQNNSCPHIINAYKEYINKSTQISQFLVFDDIPLN